MLEASDDFHEVSDIIARHAMLDALDADLRAQQRAAAEAAEAAKRAPPAPRAPLCLPGPPGCAEPRCLACANGHAWFCVCDGVLRASRACARTPCLQPRSLTAPSLTPQASWVPPLNAWHCKGHHASD